ncbi:hypothetical protein ACYSTM_21060, partial [Bacillus licheniformis]
RNPSPSFDEVGKLKSTEEAPSTGGIDIDFEKYKRKNKPYSKVQHTLWLEHEVSEALNAFGHKNGHGSKSEIVNDLLKKAFNLE